MHRRSSTLMARALKRIPGGVNSPVRAFRSVGGDPRFIVSGRGSRIIDADRNSYIDYVGSWGPLVLGHAHPVVQDALRRQVARGTSFGAPTENEVVLAELICRTWPSIESVRLVNSGTEATMSAIRVARAFTGREKIIKFDGCYHGHADGLLVQAGSGVATLGLPDSPGVPASTAALTLSLPFNDLDAVRRAMNQNRAGIACLIVEPVVGNMGVVPPARGFLQGLRKLAREHGSLLIFDEVMTGFRVSFGGAQKLQGVRPDLTCLGKIIGGGLPVGAYGGRREIMNLMAPAGPVYQAGTLSGNPLAVAAGLATLTALKRPGSYSSLERSSAILEKGLRAGADAAKVPVQINRVGSMLTVFFTHQPVTDYASAKTSSTARYRAFFHGLLDRGVYFPPSQFEAAFVSLAHSNRDIEATIRVARAAFKAAAEIP